MRVLFFAMALFVGAVVAWVLTGPHRTVVHERTRTGPVLVAPPFTPLQQRRARRSSAGRSPDSARIGASPSGSVKAPTAPRPATHPTARKSPRPTRKHRTAAPAPAATQPQSAPPPAQAAPQPGVTVPLPSVCVPPVRIGTCP